MAGWQWDPTLYGGSAPYYLKGRLPYAPHLAQAFVDALDLDGTGRLIDVGTGPGNLAMDLAPFFEEVLGIDADADMVLEAAREGRRRGIDERDVAQPARRAPSGRPWVVSGGDVRPVLPLDAAGSGRTGYSAHARAGLREARSRSRLYASRGGCRRPAGASNSPVRFDSRTRRAIPRLASSRRTGRAPRRDAVGRGMGAGPGGLLRSGRRHHRRHSGDHEDGGRGCRFGVLGLALCPTPVR